MPVYNAERYLEEAIESVLGQTFEQLELVAVDDGSQDGSRAILERHAASDRRITRLDPSSDRRAGAGALTRTRQGRASFRMLSCG